MHPPKTKSKGHSRLQANQIFQLMLRNFCEFQWTSWIGGQEFSYERSNTITSLRTWEFFCPLPKIWSQFQLFFWPFSGGAALVD